MKRIYPLILMAGILFTFTTCDKEDIDDDQDPTPENPADTVDSGTIELVFQPYYEDQPLIFGEIYTTPSNYRLQVESFLFYLSNIEVTSDEGTISEGVKIALMEYDNEPMELSFKSDAGEYSGFSFAFGVPAEMNTDTDPTQYPNSHPLSDQGSQGLFWTWNTGYVFTEFSGRADLTGIEGNDLNHTYGFHCGNDALFETREYPDHSFSVEENQTTTLTFKIQVDQFLDNPENPIDIAEDDITHSSGEEGLALAQKLVNNFYGATTLEE